MFALIANEFANGQIIYRPWGATLDDEAVVQTLAAGFLNIGHFLVRSSNAGTDQKVLIRTFAYVILAALNRVTADSVARVVVECVNRGRDEAIPDDILEILLMPVINQLLSEMQDLCSSDCKRISGLDRSALTEEKDEVDGYWLRLEPEGIDEPGDRRFLRIESYAEPCKVGFPVDK